MQDGSSLNFVICSSFLVVHLLPREDESLLWRRDAFLLFNTFLDPLNLVSRFDIDLYFLASKSFHLDEHRV